MTREIDVTITLTYDYEPAEPEVGIPAASVVIADTVLDDLQKLAWANEERLSEEP